MNQSPPRWLLIALCIAALGYSLAAGLRTVSDYDVGWQMATGRWVMAHHQVPSTDVFSYTAAGQPWIYPVVSCLVLYAVFAAGGYALLSWLGALACAGTAMLLVRRNSFAAALAVLAIPRLAARTGPRADMFTTLFFAACFALLWAYHRKGEARLWVLPLLTAAWVNLHLGFVAGLAALVAYFWLELGEMPWAGERRMQALARLKRAAPWMLASMAATLANPWGWNIYRALYRQEQAMQLHARWISEWTPVPAGWLDAGALLELRDPKSTVLLLLLAALVAVVAALLLRRPAAALLLAGCGWLAMRHVRFLALFACVVVVVAGSMFADAWDRVQPALGNARATRAVAVILVALVVMFAAVRSFDLVSNRYYLSHTEIAQFGAGLSWRFEEGAAAFLERLKIPGQMFNVYDDGGFVVWRLGESRRDYIDGRAIPFGPERFLLEDRLLHAPLDSKLWQTEAERFDIRLILLPLARFDGLQFVPRLREYCNSAAWRPVYLDEVSAVFARRTPETEAWVQQAQIDCSTAQIPAAAAHGGGRATEFNRWANAAAVLYVLGRNQEALSASEQAGKIFAGSSSLRFIRGRTLASLGRMSEAEREFRAATELDSSEATWSALAQFYQMMGRAEDAGAAWARVAQLSNTPYLARLNQAYAYLAGGMSQNALRAFDAAEREAPADTGGNGFAMNLARGRATAWARMGNLPQAVAYAEAATRVAPNVPDPWQDLARYYAAQGRNEEAQEAENRAAALAAARPDE